MPPLRTESRPVVAAPAINNGLEATESSEEALLVYRADFTGLRSITSMLKPSPPSPGCCMPEFLLS